MGAAGGIQGKHGLVEGRDVPWILRQWAERRPDKTFLVWEPGEGQRRQWTYAEFERDVQAVAAGLARRGVASGDRVVIHLENAPEFLQAWFACAWLGAVAVCTNTRSVAAELEYFIAHTGAVAAITQASLVRPLLDAGRPLRFIALTDPPIAAPPPTWPHAPIIAFSELFAADAQPVPARPADPGLDLAIQFTSGTTSRPKAVVFTHANAVWGAQANAANFKLTSEDVTLVQLPLYHINALSYLMWTTLWVGGTLVLQPKVSISTFWDVSVRNGCTVASVLAFAADLLKDQPVPAHAYRLWIFGAAYPAWEALFRVQFLPFWGMTETVSAGIVGDLSHPGPFMCIGRQAPGYEIAVRGENGPVEPGQSGRLYVRAERGVALFKEYLDDEAANLAAFDAEGWFDTGDLVQVDAAGNLFFGDRVKDVIRVGGENVSASEVERVIGASGLVGDCAVVAARHAQLGEVPVAVVVPRTPASADLEAAIIAACAKDLSDFKVVRRVLCVPELPRNTLGKVDKKALRALADTPAPN